MIRILDNDKPSANFFCFGRESDGKSDTLLDGPQLAE